MTSLVKLLFLLGFALCQLICMFLITSAKFLFLKVSFVKSWGYDVGQQTLKIGYQRIMRYITRISPNAAILSACAVQNWLLGMSSPQLPSVFIGPIMENLKRLAFSCYKKIYLIFHKHTLFSWNFYFVSHLVVVL